jgi:hypothetical protein
MGGTSNPIRLDLDLSSLDVLQDVNEIDAVVVASGDPAIPLIT